MIDMIDLQKNHRKLIVECGCRYTIDDGGIVRNLHGHSIKPVDTKTRRKIPLYNDLTKKIELHDLDSLMKRYWGDENYE